MYTHANDTLPLYWGNKLNWLVHSLLCKAEVHVAIRVALVFIGLLEYKMLHIACFGHDFCSVKLQARWLLIELFFQVFSLNSQSDMHRLVISGLSWHKIIKSDLIQSGFIFRVWHISNLFDPEIWWSNISVLAFLNTCPETFPHQCSRGCSSSSYQSRCSWRRWERSRDS